jgi:TPR repeat protein
VTSRRDVEQVPNAKRNGQNAVGNVNVKTLLLGLGMSLLLVGQTLGGQPGDVADRNRLAELRANAARGDAKFQNELGLRFAKGQGVPTNVVEAVKWFRKAAAQDYAAAEFNLGVSYALGRGVTKNEAEAVTWFRKAAEQNLDKAQFDLGLCYAVGRGVTNDVVEAVKWFRLAAEQNLDVAQYLLGDYYAKGHGVARDDVEAVKWIVLAAAQGSQEAKADIPWIEKNVPQKEIAEGKRRAIDWLEKRRRAIIGGDVYP